MNTIAAMTLPIEIMPLAPSDQLCCRFVLELRRSAMFEGGLSRELEYSIRLYGLHELGKMLHDVGFKVVEVTGHPAHPGVFFGTESPRLIILAERS